MSLILPENNDFDLFAKLIAMDQSIRRKEVNGTIQFVIVDVLDKLMDKTRQRDANRFWYDFKKSRQMKDKSEIFGSISVPNKDGKRSRKMDVADYAGILYIATSLPDEKARLLRQYVANRMAQLSEPMFKYLMRQQSQGKALAAEEIRYYFESEQVSTPDDDDAFTDMGYNRER